MEANRLKEVRSKKRLKQKEVAEALNISRSTYASYETGRSNPDHETLKKICQYLNISADYLLGNTDVPISLKEVKFIREIEKGSSDQELLEQYNLKLRNEDISDEEAKMMLKIIRALMKDKV